MMRPLIALAAVLALSVPSFAQYYPSTTIVNQGSFNVNKVVNSSGPVWSGYPGYTPAYPGYPAFGPSNTIYNYGHGNTNVIKNYSPWGGYGMPAQNTIMNYGHGNFNKIINR